MVLKTGLDDMTDKPFEQWQPQLQVTSRMEGINFYKNVIGVKCGFSNGYFTPEGKQGMKTATEIEAEESATINTMMMYRQVLDRPNSNGDGRIGVIHDIAYIINSMLIINGEILPSEYGNYELYCEFSDPFENNEEDRQRAYQLMIQGIYPKWYYLVHYEGFTEEDARALVEDARSEKETEMGGSLFGEE